MYPKMTPSIALKIDACIFLLGGAGFILGLYVYGIEKIAMPIWPLFFCSIIFFMYVAINHLLVKYVVGHLIPFLIELQLLISIYICFLIMKLT